MEISNIYVTNHTIMDGLPLVFINSLEDTASELVEHVDTLCWFLMGGPCHVLSLKYANVACLFRLFSPMLHFNFNKSLYPACTGELIKR